MGTRSAGIFCLLHVCHMCARPVMESAACGCTHGVTGAAEEVAPSGCLFLVLQIGGSKLRIM